MQTQSETSVTEGSAALLDPANKAALEAAVVALGGEVRWPAEPLPPAEGRVTEEAKSTSTAGPSLPEIKQEVAGTFKKVDDQGGEEEIELLKLARLGWPSGVRPGSGVSAG